MSITLTCSCGKTLEVDDIHRGKKAKCPACGNVLLVEGPAETAVQAVQPRPRPAADKAAATKPAAAKRSMMPWLLAGGCGLLAVLMCMISAGGAGVWYFFLRSSDAADLAFVHADVAGFISIRFGDAMKNQAIKDQIGRLPNEQKKLLDTKTAQMKDKFGITLEDLERATIVFRSFHDRNGPPDHVMAIVLRASKPFDKKKILAFLELEKKEKKHDGIVYHVLDGGEANSTALCFISDRILLVTPNEANLKDFLTQSTKPATHPAIASGVKLAASGKHQIVAAFKWNDALMENLGMRDAPQDMRDAPRELESLRDMNGITVVGTLDKQLSVEAVGSFANAGAASRVKTDLDKFRRDALDRMKNNPMRRDGPERLIFNLFEAATIEQRSADVVAKSMVDPEIKGFADEFLHNLDFRSPKQVQSINNLKNIGVSMHAFHDVTKQLPAHAIRDPKTGQPLLSWRVTLLPYVEEGKLFNNIRHNEPWDSAHNRQFWDKMPKVYQLPGKPNDGKTYYQVFHGDESAFPLWKGGPGGNLMGSRTRLTDITDGTSNTIFVVEAADAVNWMRPDDIPFRRKDVRLPERLGSHWGDGMVNVLMGDGTVRTMRRILPAHTLEALVTRNGGEVVDDRDW